MYLTLEEIEEHGLEIQKEFRALIENKKIIPKKDSNQWRFFESYFDLLLKKESTFSCSAVRAREHRHEIARRFHSFDKILSSASRKFRFAITHKKHLPPEFSDYPSCGNGYVMTISLNLTAIEGFHEGSVLEEFIEKSVSDAIDLEFEVYKKLPTNDLPKLLLELQKAFDKDGKAYEKIFNTLQKHNNLKHTIVNLDNPSRRQLKDIALVSLDRKNGKARIETKEYFYLKWYSEKKKDYLRKSYRKINIQTYILEWKNGKWMVIENVYPEKSPKKLS